MHKNFWDLMSESVIMQGIITIGVLGVYAYMLVTSMEIPSNLDSIVGLVVGFFFGGKAVQGAQAIAKTMSGK